MSIGEKAEEMVTMIDKQKAALREIVVRATQGGEFTIAEERLARWKSRTVRLLSQKINPDDGKRLEELRLTSIHMYDQLGNIRDEADMYDAFLQALKEELSEHPEDVLSIPATSDEPVTSYQAPKPTASTTVFVVHGRNDALRESMFNFLRAIGLNPLEWSQAIKATKKSTPYIGEILNTAFKLAQAIVVIFSGDDEARLRDKFLGQDEPPHEKELTPQSRPNVIFEAGMAVGGNEDRTILVQVGRLRPISDIAGRHITHLDNSPQKRQELATKLTGAGCKVDTSGTDWLNVGNFQE